ncbi:AraC family transcriptional regulator [Clostridium brassicae]|uniref:AraC family transcriptional regulator n=1 Tax=Clostridium brassicae TaxID=2999072 RepID=A0ABT4DCT2_9CLOT|nr:AraC family transcriptional regulator [Clostridium brassicae]MCY6960097.1 AraC family transcriptional regulator [Clostridium brassicae]
MDYIKSLEKAIMYIEENLNEDLKTEDVAKSIGYSYYHFTRLFEGLLGETIGNYIRKRRITKAAQDLIYTDKKIIDIALDFQFKSPEAFARSFKKIYDATPTEYRRNRIDVLKGNKKYIDNERLKHILNNITIQPVIKVIPEVKVIGIKGRTSLKNNLLPDLWNAFNKNSSKIINKAEPLKYYGICENDRSNNQFGKNVAYSEIVGVEVTSFEYIPDEMISKVIPKGKYVVFTHKGSVEKLQETYEYIWGTWIPFSKIELNMRDDFELYDERFKGANNHLSEIDIYIPIK